jgi:hypothetical protein
VIALSFRTCTRFLRRYMWNFRQIVPRPESFRHCRLLESKRVERGGREGRRRETRVLVSISPEPKGRGTRSRALGGSAQLIRGWWVPDTQCYKERGGGHGSNHEVDCASITHPETLPPEGALECREAPPTPLLRPVSAAASPSPDAAPVNPGGRPPPHRVSPAPLHRQRTTTWPRI